MLVGTIRERWARGGERGSRLLTKDRTTNGIARRLLLRYDGDVERIAPEMLREVTTELGLRPLPIEHQWPADFVDVVRVFLVHVATNDLEGIRAADSIFENGGHESARGGVPFDTAAAAARLITRRIQAHVHRAAIADGLTDDPDALLELLSRVIAAGEYAVEALSHGYALTAGHPVDGGALAESLGGALIHGRARAVEQAAAAGWPEDALVCAILTSAETAKRISSESDIVVGRYHRDDDDVLLMHPVQPGTLATTLHRTLTGHPCVVGPAVPLTDVRESLDLAQRTSALAANDEGPVFADDLILRLAGPVDDVVVDALHRKYFLDLDELPDDQRSLLVGTLREWLLQWGHRPGIARTLGVHPQTVSGRMQRIKDLVANDLEDSTVRAELLMLTIAERPGASGTT
ncbi:hypothetical protein BJY20_000796 [Janibacter cremeus]|uniref:PucR C-terminal helix-turn-helix domain-containing protein n=1 Tax=Janibacter cremeus TaxID=1285192 RepID=A0A852VSW5_9MICO|nr:hypothetical protein [Janibacter cremeus]